MASYHPNYLEAVGDTSHVPQGLALVPQAISCNGWPSGAIFNIVPSNQRNGQGFSVRLFGNLRDMGYYEFALDLQALKRLLRCKKLFPQTIVRLICSSNSRFAWVHAKPLPYPPTERLVKTTGYILPPCSALHDANRTQLCYSLCYTCARRVRDCGLTFMADLPKRGVPPTGTAARLEQGGLFHIN